MRHEGRSTSISLQLNPQFQHHSPESLATYMVMVERWSDGSPAPIH
jgi:hypothetical protein